MILILTAAAAAGHNHQQHHRIMMIPPLLMPKCCRFCAQECPFSVLRQAQECPFGAQECPFCVLKNAPFPLPGAKRKSTKNHSPTMADTNSLLHYSNSNKNKQYLTANTMRRPSYHHCWSDDAGNRVKNCTFISVIEWIHRLFLFNSHDAATPLRRCDDLLSP